MANSPYRLYVYSYLQWLLFAVLISDSTPSLQTQTHRHTVGIRSLKAALLLLTSQLAPPLEQALASVNPQELSSVFDSVWQAEDATSSYPLDTAFRRLDETSDQLFYTESRFVEHVDDAAVTALTRFHTKALSDQAALLKRPVDVLDLCSSWTSHVTLQQPFLNRFVGLGLNALELSSNPAFTDGPQKFVVQDLNLQPRLPYNDAQFDAVLLQLSIDYLTKPVEVLREVSRVLRPQGRIYISFSNRLFITKAVAVWTGKPDIEHVEIVGDYLKLAAYEMPPTVVDLLPGNGKSKGDPLYVVIGTVARPNQVPAN